MTTLPGNSSLAIDELESAIADMELRLEAARVERDEARARQTELEIENANLRQELNLAGDRQGATAGILKVIAGSAADVQPVFEAIVSSAAKLFEPCSATITTLEDGELHWIATAASITGFDVDRARSVYPIPFDPDRSPSARTILERRVIEIPDVNAPDTPEFTRKAAIAGGFRSITFVPMIDQDQGIGTIIFTHPQAGFRFSEGQLAIVQTFADQAVIAIKNARLFNETKETLERQTATADVLNVISRSLTDARPVFDVIGERAEKLCNAEISVISVVDGDLIKVAGIRGISREDVELFRANFPMPVNRQTVTARTIKSGTVVHISDVLADTTYDNKGLAAQTGYRSCLGVPMHYKGEIVGAIFVARTDPGVFSDSQIRLLEIFADQAVIAIQNVRLFNETREALEQQKASADILRVISSSVANAQPAFSKILESCKHLFSSDETAVLLVDDEDSVSLGAYVGEQHDAVAASFPAPVDKSAAGRAIRERRVMHYTDVASNPLLTRAVRHVAQLAGYESMAYAPMLWKDRGIGVIGVSRVKGKFSDKELALLQTFADQAVIAIQNSRLFNETQEALERQTATAEILKVIASSPSDVLPVFEAIVSSAKRLLGGFSAAVFRFTEGIAHLEAMTPTNPAADAIMKNSFPRPVADFQSFAMAQAGRIVQTPDTDALSDEIRYIARTRGFRSMLIAPLLREGTPIGLISVTRVEPGPFSAHFVQLLQTFADQAVIAIRNVGLFNEVQARTDDLSESLRQQTAVGEVLKTISRSTFELQPVLDTLVNSAAQLCDADMAFIMRRVGDEYRAAAAVGYTETYIDFISNRPLTVNRGTVTGRAVLERHPVQILDVAVDSEYRLHEATTLAGQRTTLGVPLLRESEPIGVIVLARQRVAAFTQKQIDLVATFADQAVIAIENVRLFNEVQQRTEDLSEALQQQTATADVLKLISRSAFDLQTVLDTLTESAARLCNADMGAIALRDERGFYHATNYNFSVDWIRLTDNLRLQPGRDSLIGRTLLARTAVQIEDVLADPDYQFPDIQKAAGYRSLLGVPLMRGGEPIGVLFLGRKVVESYSHKQTELVSTFADQAVIAIENVRLFDEVQAKTRDLGEALTYQTGSANILKVIASSPTDVGPVLKAIVESACELCEAYDSIAFLKEGDHLRFSAHHGPIPMDLDKWPINRGWVTGRCVVDQKPVHVHDLMAEGDEFPDGRAMSARMGHRTMVAVPLLRDGESIGAIILRRTEVNPFSDKQINLLQTFADQAVIAIGNVRLFEEVQAKTRDLTESLQQQTATGEVLKVIASSPTDVQPALQAIVESACAFCDAYDAGVLLKDGDHLHFSAHHGPIPTGQEPRPISRDWVVGRSVVDRVPVQVPDFQAPAAAEFPEGQRQSREQGHRCTLSVPLMREGEVIGALALRRLEPVAFSDKQIALSQTFADQAVIAIGNVRLFEEVQARTRDLQEALTYQTGSANILKVIASSPTDIDPVLQSIVESACELCAASDAVVLLREGNDLRFRAHHGPIEINIEKWPIGRDWTAGRAFLDQTTIHVTDVFSDQATDFGSSRELSRHTGGNGIRTVLSVPLLREGESLGVLTLRRQDVSPFSDKQINLLQTFADQAVIAIGNVRLFEEVQTRTRELTESLQQQTATADVLRVISRSTFDLPAVLQTLVESAARLCDADKTVITREKNGAFYRAEAYGFSAEFRNYVKDSPIEVDRGSTFGRALLEGRVVHIPDVLADSEYTYLEGQRLGGYRTVLTVPMLRQDVSIGVLSLTRSEVRPFTAKQIELATTFADQAAIAIENVRLFQSVEARTHELSKSLDDLRTAQDRLVQTEKLASLGQLTAGIAHEIKNPLNFVNNFAALSAELTAELNDVLKPIEFAKNARAEVDELTELLKENLKKVVQHGKRADSIVKNMLLHSREGGGEHRLTDVNALVEESLNLAYHGARAEKPGFNVTLERDFDPAAGQADLFPQEITRVFLNLVSNGFYAVTKRKKEDGELGFDPTLRASTKNLGDAVEIRIRDNGTGIPPEVRERMFNPFFTTKPAGEGTGLGLSMSHDIIVKQHGGTIEVDTEQGHFTEFRIVLPRASSFAE